MTQSTSDQTGILALVGGGEWQDGCREFDAALLKASAEPEVLVLPTAAAYENPQSRIDAATAYFSELGGQVRGLMVLGRTDADDEANARAVAEAGFVYISSGSPLHLKSVLKGSRLWDALLGAWQEGATLAASAAGAMVLCDPMVDPRGGAYTVGLGLLANLPVFPHHDTAPAHLMERSTELRPEGATLIGIDEQTALIREPDGAWRVTGVGSVTLYGPERGAEACVYGPDSALPHLGA